MAPRGWSFMASIMANPRGRPIWRPMAICMHDHTSWTLRLKSWTEGKEGSVRAARQAFPAGLVNVQAREDADDDACSFVLCITHSFHSASHMDHTPPRPSTSMRITPYVLTLPLPETPSLTLPFTHIDQSSRTPLDQCQEAQAQAN
jgi:hypothetical protein